MCYFVDYDIYFKKLKIRNGGLLKQLSEFVAPSGSYLNYDLEFYNMQKFIMCILSFFIIKLPVNMKKYIYCSLFSYSFSPYIFESLWKRFNLQVLRELTSVLKRFSKDKDCIIMTLTSDSKSFCLGLDYTTLVEDDEETRKELATELSENVK